MQCIALAAPLYSKSIIANGAIAFAKVRKKNNYSNFSATFSSISFVPTSLTTFHSAKRTGKKSNQKEIQTQKKKSAWTSICYFILLQLLSPTFKNVSFYQINNRLVTISSDKVHELLVAISIYNNRSIREPRYLMAKRG